MAVHCPGVDSNLSKTALLCIKLDAVGGGWDIVYISATADVGALQ